MKTSDCKVLKIHKNLKKTKNAILTQVQTDRINLAIFLNKVKMSDYLSSMCRCEQTQKTAAHVIVHYQLYAEIRRELYESDRQMNIRVLISSAKKVQHLA